MKFKPRILIIGSTGKLGSTLLKFCSKKKIKIHAITGFKNKKKLNFQKNNYYIKNSFLLSDKIEEQNFNKFLTISKIDIVYFLDYGCESILYADIFLSELIYLIKHT